MLLNFGSDLTDRLHVGMQFFSRDLGRTDNNELVIDWAYGDYLWRDWLGIRVGVLRMVHGLYSEIRDQDMLRTSVFLPQSIYPEVDRDYYTRMYGGQIYGNIPMSSFGDLTYRFLVGTYNPNTDSSSLTIRIEDSGFFEVRKFNHDGIQYNGSLNWETPLEGLRICTTGWIMNTAGADLIAPDGFGPMIPQNSAITIDVERWSVVSSIEYTWQNLRFAAEYRLENTKNDWLGIADAFDSEVDAEGYYLELSYRFSRWLEMGTYYSKFYPNKDDKDGKQNIAYGMDDFLAWQKDFAISARFDINDHWLIKLEGHYMDGAADWLFTNDNPDGMEQNDFLLAGKVTFNF